MEGYLSEGDMAAYVCLDSKKFSDVAQANNRMIAKPCSVEQVVSMADCIRAGAPLLTHGTEIDKKEGEVFGVFKAGIPKEEKMGRLVFDLPA